MGRLSTANLWVFAGTFPTTSPSSGAGCVRLFGGREAWDASVAVAVTVRDFLFELVDSWSTSFESFRFTPAEGELSNTTREAWEMSVAVAVTVRGFLVGVAD